MTARRRGGRGGAAIAAAVFAVGLAGAAHADPLRTQAAPVAPNFVSAADGQDLSKPWSVPTAHKTLQLDSKGRWGVRLDMEQPSGRSSDWKDVEAGAYLRLTPRLRVGGSVGLGDKFPDPQHFTPDDTAPRVHLETAFKF